MTETATVPMTLRCACGTEGTASLGGADTAVWTCPTCARRWRPDPEAMAKAITGANELRRLQRFVVLVLAAAVLLAVALLVIHPPWVLGVPMLVGGAALLTGPSYRARVRHGRAALHTPIDVRAA